MILLKSIPLSLLTKIYDGFDANFFAQLIKDNPGIGKENDTNFIINIPFGINNLYNLQHLQIFSTFTNIAQRYCNGLHIIKNQ